MHVINDANIFQTLIEAIRLRAANVRVELEGEGVATIAVGQRMMIKIRDFGRRIDCYRHPMHPQERGREAVLEAHALVRNALADSIINMFKIVVS